LLFGCEDNHLLDIFIEILIFLLCRLLVFGSRSLINRGLILVPPACMSAASPVSEASRFVQTFTRIKTFYLIFTAVPSALWPCLIFLIVVITAPLLAGNLLVLLLVLLLITTPPTLRAIILPRSSIPFLRLLLRGHFLLGLCSPFHSVLRCCCLLARRVSSAGTSRRLINSL
jgi:hypothetical protein